MVDGRRSVLQRAAGSGAVEGAHVAVAASWGGFGSVPDAEDLVRALVEVVGEAGADVRARAKVLALMMA
jgi:hypothetical protein